MEFLQFKNKFQSKDYQGAIEWLENNHNELGKATYHYNLGTLQTKLEIWGKARYNLEVAKSYELIPGKIENNLEALRFHQNLKQLEPTHWLTELLSVPTPLIVVPSIVFLIFAVLAAKKKLWSWAGGIFGLITVWCFILLTPHLFFKLAVVNEPTGLYEGPSQLFQTSRELPPGLKLVVKEVQDGWALIDQPQTMKGWVKRTDLLFLDGTGL